MGTGYFLHALNNIMEKQELQYDLLVRNAIGGVLASYMHQRILERPKRVKEFIELNDNCNEFLFPDTLSYLDLEVVDKDLILLSDESIHQLRKCYHKERG